MQKTWNGKKVVLTVTEHEPDFSFSADQAIAAVDCVLLIIDTIQCPDTELEEK